MQKALASSPLRVVLALLLIVAAALSACASSETPADGDLALENLDPKRQIVTYWHPYSGARGELLSALVDEFNSTNEWDIVVLPESLGNPDDLHSDMLSGLASGKAPSIVTEYTSRAAAYAGQHALVPVDRYVASPKWGYTAEESLDFYPAALTAGYLPQFNAWYGWLIEQSTDVLYYNKDWLAELGYGGPPDTWGTFAEMACAAAQQPFSDSKGEGRVLGYEPSASARAIVTLLLSSGSPVVSADGTAYLFNSSEAHQMGVYLQGMLNQGCADIAASDDPSVGFSAGRVLFAIAPMHQLPQYQAAVIEGAGFDWDIVPPPRLTQEARPRVHIYGPSLFITRSTPEEQLAAWLFVRWMSQPEQQARWAVGTGYYPIRRSAVDLMDNYLAAHPAYEKALGYLALDYGFEPALQGYDECRTVVEQIPTLLRSGVDVQAALDDAVNRCNASLQNASP